MTITPEMKYAVEQAGEEPLHLDDPESRRWYVVVREEVYYKLQSLVGMETGEVSIDEHKAALASLGRSIGWDDPAMDIDNDL